MAVPPDVRRNTPAPMPVPFGVAHKTPAPMAVPPGVRRNTPAPVRVPPGVRRNTPAPIQAPPAVRAHQTTLEIPMPVQPRRVNMALLGGTVALSFVLFMLIWKTPVGVMLGLRTPETGFIEVRTSPAVPADITLDDIYRGHPPLRISGVRPGTRRLEVKADGYVPVTKVIEVSSNATLMIDLTLTPEVKPSTAAPAPAPPPGAGSEPGKAEPTPEQPPAARPASKPRDARAAASAPAATDSGMLMVNSMPSSLVFIDGHDTGRSTPLNGYPIAAGPHELRLKTANGQEHVERIDVRAGQTTSIVRRF